MVTDPQVSPDGRLVAYVVESLNGEKDAYQTDVWLVPAAGGEARALASSPVGDDTPRWSPDGRFVAFLSERPRPGARADDASDAKRQVWLIRPDGGEAVPLTEAPGSVSDFEWSADGKTVAFLAREPKSDERKRREKEKDDAWTPSETYAWNRLWTIDVATRQARQLTTGQLHVTGMSLSPDGQTVAFAGPADRPLIPDSFRSDIYTIPAAGGVPTPLVARQGTDNAPAWSPDGKWIAFVSQDGRDEEWYTNTSVSVVPAEGGAPRTLTASLDERIGGLCGSALTWTPDSAAVLFPVVWRTAAHVYRATLDGKVEPLTSGPEVNGAPSIDRKGETLVFLREDSVTPREVWTLRLGVPAAARGPRGCPAATPKPLTDTNPQVREPPLLPQGARDLEGRGRLGHGGPPRPSPGLHEGHARPAGPQRPRRARRHALERLHSRAAPVGLAALRAEGLRHLLPQPARQRRLRRGVSAPPTCATGASRTTRTS